MNVGKLIFFCGKMGSGKSTRARKIVRNSNAVLLSEDEWLAALYPGQVRSLQDYLTYSNRLKPQMQKLAQDILLSGVDVVMDFPANTEAQRGWFKQIFTSVAASHNLIYLDVTDEVCLARISERAKQQLERVATDTPEMFAAVTKYFVPPAAKEGFNIDVIR